MKRILATSLLLVAALPVSARTIVITDEDCERMAAISPEAPRLGWAAYECSPGCWSTQYTIQMNPGKAFLICFPLDRVPKGQRITNAELIVPVSHLDNDCRLHVRRIIGDWGVGVCHQYRMVRPKKVEWGKPGARAVSTDCAAKPTAVLRIGAKGDKPVNVTEDVELWYTGASTNQGWVLSVEEQGGGLQLLSPLSYYPFGRGSWKLRITYEPE